jgi:hypothetical protein
MIRFIRNYLKLMRVFRGMGMNRRQLVYETLKVLLMPAYRRKWFRFEDWLDE